MTSLFLFGAGASFGSGPCRPHPPPLGGHFFAALRQQGGVANEIGDELASVFAADFEAGMDRFRIEHNTLTTSLLRDMAKYFAPFEPASGNLYMEIIRALGGTRKKAVLVTTNYDLLIERAIGEVGLAVSYTGFPVPLNNIPVLKIHGSCNFLPNLDFRIRSIDFKTDPSQSVLDADVFPASTTEEIIRFCTEQDSIAPALALYSPDKKILYCPTFVKNQQEAWRTSLKSASRIYVIGLRVHEVDAHIWGELAVARAPLFYVGFEPEVFESWARKRRGRCYVLGQTFKSAIPTIRRHLGGT